MKNGERPISPLQHEGFPSNDSIIEKNSMIGLTKREYFAGLAMQGILANSDFTANLRDCLDAKFHCQFVTECAIEQADELLKQLEKTKI